MDTTEAGYINATVAVPAERLADFYEMFGRWLAGASGRLVSSSAPRLSWGADEVATAVEFYEWISAKAALILDFWMDHPGIWLTSSDTAAAAGLAGAYGVAGSLSSVGKAAAKFGRELPFEWRAGAAGAPGSYRMSESTAELFQAARAAADRR
jgi:Family of unknown function (DUF6416)